MGKRAVDQRLRVVLIITLFVVGLVIILVPQNRKNVVSLCSGDGLRDKASDQTILLSENRERLAQLVTEIKQKNDYTTISDCMYLVTLDSLNNTRIDEAQSALDTYRTLFEQQGLREPLNSYGVQSPDEIQRAIDLYREATSKSAAESFIIPNTNDGRSQ